MGISLPISTEDLDTLPDNTDLIENLATKNEITTVLPRFTETEDTGRFVTAFFVFPGTTVTLYTRENHSNTESSLEKQTTVQLTNSPTIVGELWNQTLIIEIPDIETIEHLKQRVTTHSNHNSR